MKITTLLETMTTPTSDPAANQSQQAPHFGRDPKVLEDDEKLDETSAGATGSGSVVSVAQPAGGMQKRAKGSIFAGVKTSKKFPNSAAVKESAENPHTSAIGHALFRDLSKEKKASPAQVKRNEIRWAQRQKAKAEQPPTKGMSDAEKVDKGWRNPNVDEGELNESSTIDFIRGLISEFNEQMSGSPYYPMDYKNPGMRMWTRGDGSRYKDPGYIFIDRDLKPEDQPKWHKAKAVEKFWKFLESKGARKIGDVSGEFGSDPHSPAVVLNKLIFVFNGRSIAWGSTSRLKNSNVWRQKQQDVAEDDAGDVEQRMLVKIEKEKQRLAQLKKTDPEAYKREMAKRKTSSRIPPVSTFEQQGVAEGLGEQPNPKSVGMFLYNALQCGLDDINIPYQQGTPEYHQFILGFKKAYADQTRKYLRLGGENPEALGNYFGIRNGNEWIAKATKQGVAEGSEQSTDEILEKLTAAYRTCVKHRDSYTNFGNIQTVYELLRDPLMQGDIQGYEKAHAYVSGKYPDAFDLLMDEVPQQGVAEADWHTEPEQEKIDATRQARLNREREPAGSDKIDAMLAQRYEQEQEYNRSGKFWLKTKDTQRHVEGPFIGKEAARQAAVDLFKRAPQLKGNLLITAWGPDETPVTEAELSEEQLLAKDLKKQLEMFKKSVDHELGTKPKDKEIQKKK